MITNLFTRKLGLKIENEYSDASGKWKQFDDGSAELSVLEFLYALVRMIKPENICETGSYFGLSTCALAQGLKDNGQGKIVSVEWEKQHVETTKKNLAKLGLLSFVQMEHKSSLDYVPDRMFDFLYLDTECHLRFSELNLYWNNLKLGGIIAIHDLHAHLGNREKPWEDFVEKLGDKIKDHELTVIPFTTPRGLCLFRKFDKSDGAYKLLTGKA